MKRILKNSSLPLAGVLSLLMLASCELGSPTKGGGTEGEGVVGNLVDPSGAPLAGVWVKAFPLTGSNSTPSLAKVNAVNATVVDSALTDAQGYYHFPNLNSAGSYNLTAITTVNGTTYSLLLQSVIIGDGTTPLGVDTLQVSGSITVHVQASGEGVEGALCYLESTPWVSVTDESGECQLSGLPPGSIQVSISHPAFESVLAQAVSILSGEIINGGTVIVNTVATVTRAVKISWPDSLRFAGQGAWGLHLTRFVFSVGNVVVKDTVMSPHFGTPGSIAFSRSGLKAFGGDTLTVIGYGLVVGGPYDLMAGWNVNNPVYQTALNVNVSHLMQDTIPVPLTWVGPNSVPAAPVLIPGTTTVAPLSGTLNWNAVAIAHDYHLQLSTDSLFNAIVKSDTGLFVTSATYGPVTPGAYFWRVRARGTGGYGPWSSWSYFITVGAGNGNDSVPTPPLALPSAVAPALGATDVSVYATLIWTPGSIIRPTVGQPTRLRILLGTDTNFTSPIMDDNLTVQTSASTYTRLTPRLNPGTLYVWRVVSMGPGGDWPSPIFTFTTESPAGPVTRAPLVPISPVHNATDVPTSMTLAWSHGFSGVVFDLLGAVFDLTVARDSLFSNIVYHDSTLLVLEHQMDSLLPGTRYFWKVKTRIPDSLGTWSEPFSAFTTAGEAPTPPTPTIEAPVLSAPANADTVPTTLNLSWVKVSDAISYRLEVATDSMFASPVLADSVPHSIAAIPNQSTTIGPLNANTRYYWRMQAEKVGELSLWSAIRFFITED